MSTIGIHGASDDLVEIEIDGKPWEELSEPRSFVFTACGKSLLVDIEHDGKRGWTISTCIEDDSESGGLPFAVSIGQRNYSPLLVVHPGREPVTMTWWNEDKKPRTKTFGALPTGGAIAPKETP